MLTKHDVAVCTVSYIMATKRFSLHVNAIQYKYCVDRIILHVYRQLSSQISYSPSSITQWAPCYHTIGTLQSVLSTVTSISQSSQSDCSVVLNAWIHYCTVVLNAWINYYVMLYVYIVLNVKSSFKRAFKNDVIRGQGQTSRGDVRIV